MGWQRSAMSRKLKLDILSSIFSINCLNAVALYERREKDRADKRVF